MTPAEYAACIARMERKSEILASTQAVNEEAELHEQIMAECNRRGWIAFHGSMAHKTFRTPGEPDFLVMASGGRWFAIECKSKSGKLSPDQRAIIAWAEKLGHTIHVVRSLAEFMEIVRVK